MTKSPRTFHWPVQGRPRIRFAGYVPFDSKNMAREYCHPTVALHQHFYHGQLIVQGHAPVDLKPGDISYTLPHAVSHYELREPGYHWCIHFDPLPPARNAVVSPLHFSPRTLASYATDRFRAIFDLHIRSEEPGTGRLARETATLSLQELILWLSLNRGAGPAPRHPKRERGLERARVLLHEHFQKPLAAADAAREAGLSRNYLAVHFKRRFGMTMDAYLLRRRVDFARHLLRSTDLPVKEVAYEAGLPDPQYFNKQFRRLAGLSPTAFRSLQAPPVVKVVK